MGSVRWGLVIAMGILPFFIRGAELNTDAPEAGNRVITVSSTGQPPYKNPGIVTLGTLAIEQRVDFSVTATSAGPGGTKGGALTFAWDWGDGTPPGSGSAPNHTYVVPATYSVVVTILEAGNPTPTVLTLPVVITDAIKSARLQTNEFWASPNHDSLFFQGIIRVPANQDLKGQLLAFDIGGIQLNFVLGEKGAAGLTSNTNVVLSSATNSTSNGNVTTLVTTSTLTTNKSSVSIFVKKRPPGTPFVDAHFILRVTDASIQSALADESITNRDASRENVRITAKVTFRSILYQSGINQLFTSKKGIRGRTR